MGRLRPLVALFAIGLTASGCGNLGVLVGSPGIPGSGKVAEEDRTIGEFTEIEVHGVVAADVTAGESPMLKLSGDDNLLPLIETEVRDGRLVIRAKPGQNINPTTPLKAAVTATKPLGRAEVSGAASCRVAAPTAPKFHGQGSGATSLTLEGLDAEQLDLDASGASTVAASGKVQALTAGASGASNLRLAGLEASTADVSVSGASGAEVKATEAITGSASGASNITVLGNPPRKDVSKSGASGITYRDAK
jgi:hypothetical protein